MTDTSKRGRGRPAGVRKARKNYSLSPDVSAWLATQPNASATIDRLCRQEMTAMTQTTTAYIVRPLGQTSWATCATLDEAKAERARAIDVGLKRVIITDADGRELVNQCGEDVSRDLTLRDVLHANAEVTVRDNAGGEWTGAELLAFIESDSTWRYDDDGRDVLAREVGVAPDGIRYLNDQGYQEGAEPAYRW